MSLRSLCPLLAALALAGCAGRAARTAEAALGKVPVQFRSADPALEGAELVVFGATAASGPFQALHEKPIRWRPEDPVLFVHEGQPLGADRWYYIAARDQTGSLRKLVPVTKARVLLPAEGGAKQPPPPQGKVSR